MNTPDFATILPKKDIKWFSASSLNEGWEIYQSQRISGLNFFRSVHKAVCSDESQKYYCFYLYNPEGIKKFEQLGHCTCLYQGAKTGCEHLAALLFLLYHRSDGRVPITRHYSSSLAYKTAMALCKSHSQALPFTCNDKSSRLQIFNRKGENILQWLFLPENTGFDFVALPRYKIRCSSQHFANYCKNEITAQDQKIIKFTPKSPTIQEGLGPVGDLFRQLFLMAARLFGILSFSVEKHTFTLRLQSEEQRWKLMCTLIPEQAYFLYKSFSDRISLDDATAIRQPAYHKRFSMLGSSAGGLFIDTYLQAPGNGESFASFEADCPSFGAARYIPKRGFFPIKVKNSRTARRYCGWKRYAIEPRKVVEFLQLFQKELRDPELYLQTPELQKLTRQAGITGISLHASEKKKSRYRFHITYHLDAFDLPLKDILDYNAKGENCLLTPSGWLSFEKPDFFWIRNLKKQDIEPEDASVWLGRSRALRIFGSYNPDNIHFENSNFPALLAIKPQKVEDAEIDGDPHIGHLRGYQRQGFKWLTYIYKNSISCILADEMGLGKTHQVMALIQHIVKNAPEARALVVCPTSVIYHWRDKLKQFYPELSVVMYHSKNRDFDKDMPGKSIVITTYGIVRNDFSLLSGPDYHLLVLDEIQHSKNRDTKTYRALSQFHAQAWVGLSGTPVENSSWELKNIFDLLLPGYFPGREEFAAEIARPLDELACERAQHYLQRLIRPFMLRRTKSQVLNDLPEKVEEIYKCEMAADQSLMYAFIESERASVKDLEDDEKPIPYMHIFALLNRLKQICNHPGSLKENFSRYGKYNSGKWELFLDLLNGALESGLKTVVFSQYLNMLSIIQNYLKQNRIGFQKLIGATRNRDKVIKQFQEEESCRVFLCSTKAGGAGIDLTAASVVIHYDRWWNAAREDQATGRVHRIGQQRNVQVYKLLTLDSIEERIDNIISKKAQLADSLFGADFSDSLKMFTREELKEILGMKT